MKYLYITGLMRSGTTVLANFLNTQGKITIYRDYVNTLRQALTSNPNLEYFDNIQEKNIVIEKMRTEALDQLKLNLSINPQQIKNIYDLYKSAIDPIASPEDVIIGNKSTQSLFVLEKLLKNKDVLGLYIIRDVRDVLLSSRKRSERLIDADVINNWNTDINKVEQLKKKYPDRFLVIRYEDFVQMKANRILGDFLGVFLNWEIQVFKDRSGQLFRNNSSYTNIKKQKTIGFHLQSIGNWRKLKDEELISIRKVEDICKNGLEKYRYLNDEQLQEEKKATLEAAASREEDPPEKGGFWSRLFGK
ncbi:sulfotransferase [Peribacillus frigoritolerans]|uniref:sulfotransferase n=1 Tax=Peribacillus frigoritolerans TaxID=450367 RepID=UPI002079C040|nr:sulfotransferase [Peribacillus frigoritolerans]USK72951.1 sulfotransferase [Peribacillus frigoritolerans]